MIHALHRRGRGMVKVLIVHHALIRLWSAASLHRLGNIFPVAVKSPAGVLLNVSHVLADLAVVDLIVAGLCKRSRMKSQNPNNNSQKNSS